MLNDSKAGHLNICFVELTIHQVIFKEPNLANLLTKVWYLQVMSNISANWPTAF